MIYFIYADHDPHVHILYTVFWRAAVNIEIENNEVVLGLSKIKQKSQNKHLLYKSYTYDLWRCHKFEDKKSTIGNFFRTTAEQESTSLSLCVCSIRNISIIIIINDFAINTNEGDRPSIQFEEIKKVGNFRNLAWTIKKC